MKSKFLVTSILFAAIFSTQTANAEDFVIPYDGAYKSKPGFMEVVFSDAQSNYLESTAPNKAGDPYNAVFPACALKTARNCIASVEYKVGDGDWQSSQLSDYVQTGMDGQVDGRDENGNIFKFNNFPEDKKSGTPAGGKASTWILNGAPHEGGAEYLVSATFSSSTHFSVNLVPIKWGDLITWDWDGNSVSTRKKTEYSFPQGVQYRVSLHLGVVAQRVNTWFFGRLASPQIDIAGDLLTISALPGYSSAAASDYFSCGNSIISEAEKKRILMGNGCSYRQVSVQHDVNSIQAFKYFEPYLHQWKYQTAWTLDSQDSSSSKDVSAYRIQKECNVSGIAGVSSTNALIMQNQLPSWDPISKELIYNIASTHLDASGNPNIGNLELAVSEKLAKCLWGATTLTNAQAKVSIMYENGEKAVSTNVSELRNGWIYLRVSNFTFSSPKIKLAMTVPSKDQAKQTITIQCTKGSKILSVNGASPKCPAGYKKK
jgi:hypothetical protein